MLKKSSSALAVASVLGVISFSAHADGVPGGSMQNNPAFNVVLEGRYVDQDEAHFSLPGFQAHDSFDHLGVYENGFSSGHNEINIGGTVTDDTTGLISFALESHDGESSVDLEEAYIETTALGNGVTVKVGEFYSHIGILNTKHEHRQDFANAALVYIAMFGGHLSDTGVQFRWQKQEDNLGYSVGAEATTGTSYPGGHNEDNNGGITLFAKVNGAIGSNQSWSAGISSYSSDFDARHTGGHHGGGDEEFELEAGTVDVKGIDFEYFFSPNGKGKSGELKISLEYFVREEDGEAMFTDLVGTANAEYEGEQSGYYVAAVYRFMPQWRVGLRFEHLESDNSFSNINLGTSGLATPADFEDESRLITDREPERTTLMVDYAPNHNTVIRAQFMKDEVGAEEEDRIYLQYVVAIGGQGH